MNYLEIGNENSGPDYEKRYARCYDEIKKRYPWIKCIANTHVEKHNLPVEIVDEHYYDTAEFFAESAEMFAAYDRKGPEIFLGEVAVIRGYVGQLYGALAEAAFFTGVERNQDLVTLVSYAPLLENTNYNAWFPNLVIFNNSGSYGIPSYYVWKLFGNNRGEFIVETREETGKIYRPLKGMASLLGAGGLVFKNALWNGKKAEITHELMGTIAETAGTYTVQEPDDAQKKEARGFYGINPEDVFVIFGEEDISSGVFEIDIRADKDREIIIGIFSSRIPKEVYISDETNPPKAWNPGNVRPFLWKLSGGKSTLTEKKFMENPSLDNEKTVILRQGEFNHFQYMTDGKRLSLYANGELIHAIDIPSFRSLHTVVSDTASEIIIKTVNMADREDDVSIELDCDVRGEYKAYTLTGGKEAENSFDNPQNVHDELFNLHGAARKFTYRAPPFSVNVLRLIKNPDANGGHGR